MFCKNCGTSMSDDVKFCPSCGTPSEADSAAVVVEQPAPQPVPTVEQPVAVQPAAAPQPVAVQQPMAAAPAAPSEFSQQAGNYVSGVLQMVKPFFSSAPTKAVAGAAKNRSFAWIAVAVIGALMNAFSTLVLSSNIIGSINKLISYVDIDFISKGQVFWLSLVFGLLLFMLVAGCMRLVLAIASKKVSFSSVANVVAVSSLPVISILIINMLVALFYPLATVVFLVVSLFMSVVLLYVGLQQLDRFEKSPYWLFSGMILVVAIIGILLFNAFAKDIFATAIENAMGGFGGFGDLDSLF